MDSKRFEALTAAYYKHLGFRAETIQCGLDGGIDVKLFRGDEATPAAVVQCKARSNRPVGVKAVRELLGVMVHNKVNTGVFLATSSFTPDAVDFAKGHRIALGTGEQLLDKLKGSVPAIGHRRRGRLDYTLVPELRHQDDPAGRRRQAVLGLQRVPALPAYLPASCRRALGRRAVLIPQPPRN